jgi:hypothetical protein
MEVFNFIKKSVLGIALLVLGYYVMYAVLSILVFLMFIAGLMFLNLFGG